MRELYAELTVSCDGRSSTLRDTMGLKPRNFGAPMDVWWLQLPRNADDPHGLAGVLGTGHACVAIDRREYFQIAYIIPKGRDAELRARASKHCAAGWDTGALAGRSRRSADIVRRRQAAQRSAQPAATAGTPTDFGDAAHAT